MPTMSSLPKAFAGTDPISKIYAGSNLSWVSDLQYIEYVIPGSHFQDYNAAPEIGVNGSIQTALGWMLEDYIETNVSYISEVTSITIEFDVAIGTDDPLLIMQYADVHKDIASKSEQVAFTMDSSGCTVSTIENSMPAQDPAKKDDIYYVVGAESVDFSTFTIDIGDDGFASHSEETQTLVLNFNNPENFPLTELGQGTFIMQLLSSTTFGASDAMLNVHSFTINAVQKLTSGWPRYKGKQHNTGTYDPVAIPSTGLVCDLSDYLIPVTLDEDHADCTFEGFASFEVNVELTNIGTEGLPYLRIDLSTDMYFLVETYMANWGEVYDWLSVSEDKKTLYVGTHPDSSTIVGFPQAPDEFTPTPVLNLRLYFKKDYAFDEGDFVVSFVPLSETGEADCEYEITTQYINYFTYCPTKTFTMTDEGTGELVMVDNLLEFSFYDLADDGNIEIKYLEMDIECVDEGNPLYNPMCTISFDHSGDGEFTATTSADWFEFRDEGDETVSALFLGTSSLDDLEPPGFKIADGMCTIGWFHNQLRPPVEAYWSTDPISLHGVNVAEDDLPTYKVTRIMFEYDRQ